MLTVNMCMQGFFCSDFCFPGYVTYIFCDVVEFHETLEGRWYNGTERERESAKKKDVIIYIYIYIIERCHME